MDSSDNLKKKNIIKWLNKQVDENNIIFDYVLDIFDDIIAELQENKLELKFDEETFLINLAFFLYNNSYN